MESLKSMRMRWRVWHQSHGPVLQSPINLIPDQVETLLPVCFWIWDGFSTKMPDYKFEDKTNGPSFSPFKLVLVAGSEIENRKFH